MASIGILEYKPNVDFLIQMSTPVNAGESFKNRVSEIDAFKNRKRTIEETERIIDTFNIIIRSVDGYINIKKECERARRKLKFPKYISQIYLKPQIINIVKLDTEFYYKNVDIPLCFDPYKTRVIFLISIINYAALFFIKIKCLSLFHFSIGVILPSNP